MSLYLLNVTLHVLAALLWLGGMFFLAAVGAPVLRRVEPPALRAELFRKLGEQFRTVGWVAIGVLVVTGFGNLHFRGLLRWDVWSSAAFWGSGYGLTLAWKLAAVAVMIAISALHDFHFGPAASRLETGSAPPLALRRRAAMLARVNAGVGLVLVFAAVRLARGGLEARGRFDGWPRSVVGLHPTRVSVASRLLVPRRSGSFLTVHPPCAGDRARRQGVGAATTQESSWNPSFADSSAPV